ncbi:hypothetical protein EAE99_010133 [Botrytis elliptica]|nr:hypothetical protein EAE99_010133 [Botrytis elliptica]
MSHHSKNLLYMTAYNDFSFPKKDVLLDSGFWWLRQAMEEENFPSLPLRDQQTCISVLNVPSQTTW